MTTKLCNRCNQVLSIDMFSNRQNHGKTVKHTRCKKCRNEIHFQYVRAKKEESGKLFARTRLYDPDRADRLDRFRGMVKQGVPLTAEPIVIQKETDEYHLFYTRNKTV